MDIAHTEKMNDHPSIQYQNVVGDNFPYTVKGLLKTPLWVGKGGLAYLEYLRACQSVLIALLLPNIQATKRKRQHNEDKETVIDIEDKDKLQYHDQNFNTSAYDFGYEVGPNGQFHHENKGPDGVVYGCYGYVDPDGKLRATHYVSDGWGYRVVKPGQPVELFLHHHETNQLDSNNPGEDKEAEHKHHGQITEWKYLYFPKGCGGLHRPEGNGEANGSGGFIGAKPTENGGNKINSTTPGINESGDNQLDPDIQVDQEGLEVHRTQMVKGLLKDNQEDQDIQVGQVDPEGLEVQ
uniref:Uncharacterized protein n=1 Tax=Timema douglasi TaxID=61478 RepID=A0A7R8VIS7_TIMDO|nr:unnamed protein product [Timema douglasi]